MRVPCAGCACGPGVGAQGCGSVWGVCIHTESHTYYPTIDRGRDPAIFLYLYRRAAYTKIVSVNILRTTTYKLKLYPVSISTIYRGVPLGA